MITVQEINNRVMASLDAENSDRYLFDQDIKPAINSAMEIMVSMLNQAFAEDKLSPEALRELNKTKVWQANSYSRVAFNPTDVGHSLWTLLAIYPKPVVNRKSAGISGEQNNSVSRFRPDISFIKSTKSAKRLSSEEWNENENNAFMPGNNIIKGSLAEYAYLDASDYSSTTYPSSADKIEWTIRPDIPNQLVAINYLKYPTPVTSINDSVEFPQSTTSFLRDIVLHQIAYKQGEAPLYQISAQGINTLVKLIR